MELNSVLRKVNALIAKAEHANTPPDEADTARSMADALMLKYAIQEAQLDAARPAAERMLPDQIDFTLGAGDLDGWLATLATRVAGHCRCKTRNFAKYADGVWVGTAYGYQADLRYFELLWTTIRLHMTGILRPGMDKSKSLEDNCYDLHNAGYNWLEIARLDGWVKIELSDMFFRQASEFRAAHPEVVDMKVPFQLRSTGEVRPATQVGSHYKRAYYRAVEARGEAPTKIAASSSETYRYSAAQGYVGRLYQRLSRLEDSRQGIGTALALRADAVEDYYREQNAHLFTRCPNCGKLSDDRYTCDRCGFEIEEAPEPVKARRGRAPKERPFSYDAYQRGMRHADTADLTVGGRGTDSAAKRALD